MNTIVKHDISNEVKAGYTRALEKAASRLPDYTDVGTMMYVVNPINSAAENIRTIMDQDVNCLDYAVKQTMHPLWVSRYLGSETIRVVLPTRVKPNTAPANYRTSVGHVLSDYDYMSSFVPYANEAFVRMFEVKLKVDHATARHLAYRMTRLLEDENLRHNRVVIVEMLYAIYCSTPGNSEKSELATEYRFTDPEVLMAEIEYNAVECSDNFEQLILSVKPNGLVYRMAVAVGAVVLYEGTIISDNPSDNEQTTVDQD